MVSGSRMLYLVTETMMSNPYLPPELLDRTIDFLHDNTKALKECCLVSKSWIPRTRQHLFAHVIFHPQKSLQSWMETFPDPFNSPAHHTHTLTYSQSVECSEAGDWITSFSHVVHLDVTGLGYGPSATQSMGSLVKFHGFSPNLKSIRLDFHVLPTLQAFSLILSFPLLEDLAVVTYFWASTGGGDGPDGLSTAVQPSNPPAFAGSLILFMKGGMEPITLRLLSLPGGIHFRKLTLMWFQDSDAPLIKELVRECSGTLESLKITRSMQGTSIQHLSPSITLLQFPVESESDPIDLSKAWKLEDVALRDTKRPSVHWLSAALQTITIDHRNLREVLLYTPCMQCNPTSTSNYAAHACITRAIGEDTHRQWLEFDHLLAQLWESHSIHLKVLRYKHRDGLVCRCANSLLPEVIRRRIADLVEWS